MPVKHTIRHKDGGTRTVTMTRGKAIRLFCIECMGFNTAEPRYCTAPLCPLFPYRLGNVDTSGKVQKPASDEDLTGDSEPENG